MTIIIKINYLYIDKKLKNILYVLSKLNISNGNNHEYSK